MVIAASCERPARPDSANRTLADAVRGHIVERTWGRVHELRVVLDAEGVTVRGNAPTYCLKQLALAAVREMLPAAAVELAIQVANRGCSL